MDRRRGILWGWFVLAAALSFGAPAWMLYEQASILSEGTQVKLPTRPVDPYDPFRGRYVLLGFDTNDLPLTGNAEAAVVGGRTAYALIEIDEDGLGTFAGATLERPDQGLYAEGRVFSSRRNERVSMRLPIDRYYLNERIAPEAERLYADAARAALQRGGEGEDRMETYAIVRLHRGRMAIEGLYVNGAPVELLARESLERKQAEPAE